ncbi:MAG: hypothetical protein Q7J06_11560 [Bacteroidales bacterium]|nr:hypothetical protein [Bacteroidales bacterium]
MIYKLKLDNDKLKGLDPVPFYDFGQLKKLEKDLENLIAENLLNKLFEDNALMPIYQEKPYDSLADIYALTEKVDLVVFELKRGLVGDDAMIQILRYAQAAGQWDYDKLNSLFKKENSSFELADAHKEAFELTRSLTPIEFNRNQHLYVVGSGANETLARSLNYWHTKGLSVEFIPYRIYKIHDQLYFEFFSKPHDIHRNPNDIKGLILDTNRTYNEDCVWEMLDKNRAAAYGDQKYFADYFSKNDFVFLSHKHYGIIAGGQVISTSKADGPHERYVDVKWITKKPTIETGINNYMLFSKVTEILEHGFYWARTVKTPYLTKEESDLLMEKLKEITE